MTRIHLGCCTSPSRRTYEEYPKRPNSSRVILFFSGPTPSQKKIERLRKIWAAQLISLARNQRNPKKWAPDTQLHPHWWFGLLVWWLGEDFPFTLYKNQGFKSPNHQSKPPIKGNLIYLPIHQRDTQKSKPEYEPLVLRSVR